MTKKSTGTRTSAQAHARTRRSPKLSTSTQARTRLAQATFLREFRLRGVVLKACLAAGVGRRTYYEWMESDEAFIAARAEALDDANDLIDDEIWRRGIDGVNKPVFQGGKKVGTIREYSDTCLGILAKARRPDVYRERFEHSGPNGGPIQVADLARAKDGLTEKLAALAARLAPPESPAS